MPYPTTAELVAQSGVQELTGLSAPEQDALRAVAISAIERFTGQKFVSEAGTLAIDGSGSGELYLPRRVEVLTGVSVKGTDYDLSSVVLSDKGDRLHLAPLSTDYAIVAMRDTAWDSRTFRSGSGTVLLTGTFGWSEVPAEVAQAIRIEMEVQAQADASKMSGIVASYRRLGLRDIAQGNLRATIGSPEEISPRAQRLLTDYVWLGAGGLLV